MRDEFTASLRYRTIWLSDIHLGYRHCKADFLFECLAAAQCETLFLVGDVLDLWSLGNQWHWPAPHTAVLRALLDRAENGTRVVYVPGNHDELVRDLTGNAFGRVAIEPQAVHLTALAESADGRLELLHWPRLRESLAGRDAANGHRAPPAISAAAAARR